MYGKIENGKVVEFFRQVPRVIGNTSLPTNPTNETLKEFNILPVVGVIEPLEEWQSYGNKSYNILEDRIEEDKEVIDQPLEEYKAKKTKVLSDLCRADIVAEYDEDTQRNITARVVELVDKKIDEGLTTEEQTELTQLKQVKTFVDTRLFEYYTQKEKIIQMTSYADVQGYVNSLLPNEII